MSQIEDSSDSEFATIIAAAAYAISSQEEDGTEKPRRSSEVPQISVPKIETINEDNRIKLTDPSGSFKRWFTQKEAQEDEKPFVPYSVSGDSFTRKPTTAEQMKTEDSSSNHNTAPKEKRVKKKPTFADEQLNEKEIKRVDNGEDMKPSPIRAPLTKKPTMSSFENKVEDRNFGGHFIAEADAWEKAKMIKIRNRYDKMIALVVEWGNEKKAKAKRRLELKENGPEHKRARTLQKYGEEVARIDKVAGEARAMAEERRRNDEAKTREKARQIRLSGKLPSSACRCC